MDFLKDNLFYVVLAAAVLVVSVPCYLLGAARADEVRRAQNLAGNRIRTLKKRATTLQKVTPEAKDRAKTYREEHEQQKEKVLNQLRNADRHLDYDFLVEPEKPGGTPPPERYKEVYYNAYRQLLKRLEGLKTTKKQPLPNREDWGSQRPNQFAIRMSQKRYWILKAMVDILTDPECGVRSVQNIALDMDPRDMNGHNRLLGGYWVYPMRLEFQIDFRTFPVFQEKLINNEDVFFNPPGVWFMNRAFDDTKAVYVPVVSVSFDCDVWDYVSTPFEKDNAQKYGRKARRRQPAGRGRR